MSKVNNLSESVILTVQDGIEQASTGASPVNENETLLPPLEPASGRIGPEPKTNDAKKAPVSMEELTEPNEPKTKKQNKKAVEKSYKPAYSEQKRIELEYVSRVSKEAIESTINNPDIPTVSYGDNCLIDLKTAYKNGINLLTPDVNRLHGKDKQSTGESIRMYGAQRHLLVITKGMADAAGIDVSRFLNDSRTGDYKDIDLVLIDGNGRIDYVLGLEEEDRPRLWASFIEPDAYELYNPRKDMEIINTELSKWKTPDMLQKRLLEDGENAHEGWKFIKALTNKGYHYQSACETGTLGTDRIKVGVVNNGDPLVVFKYFESAKKIHEALVEKFGEGDDKMLKTKEFPKEVSTLWHKLEKKLGEEQATKVFLKFINGFKQEKVDKMLEFKSEKGKESKDAKRIRTLDEQFNQFIGREGIELD